MHYRISLFKNFEKIERYFDEPKKHFRKEPTGDTLQYHVNYTLFNSNYTRPVNINYPVCPVCAFRCINDAAQPLTDDGLVTYISICPGNIYAIVLAIELIPTDRTCRSVHPSRLSKKKSLQDRESFHKK